MRKLVETKKIFKKIKQLKFVKKLKLGIRI